MDNKLQQKIEETTYQKAKDFDYSSLDGVCGVLIDEMGDTKTTVQEDGSIEVVLENNASVEAEGEGVSVFMVYFFHATFDAQGNFQSSYVTGLDLDQIEELVEMEAA